MLLVMNDGQLQTVEQVRGYLEGSEAVGFEVQKRVGGYPIRPANKAIVLLTEHA